MFRLIFHFYPVSQIHIEPENDSVKHFNKKKFEIFLKISKFSKNPGNRYSIDHRLGTKCGLVQLTRRAFQIVFMSVITQRFFKLLFGFLQPKLYIIMDFTPWNLKKNNKAYQG